MICLLPTKPFNVRIATLIIPAASANSDQQLAKHYTNAMIAKNRLIILNATKKQDLLILEFRDYEIGFYQISRHY